MGSNVTSRTGDLWSADRQLQNDAFTAVMATIDEPVDWAYEVRDDVVENLEHPDNHNRAIAGQVLSGLAKSDPEQRILHDFEALVAATRDERFVTARHTMQSLWKVGVAGEPQRRAYLTALEGRFRESAAEKNCTLIRYDIAQSLRNVYDATGDEAVRSKALELIATEDNLKYRKKYQTFWKPEKSA